MAERTGPDEVTPEGCSSRSGDRARGTRLRSRGRGAPGVRTGHHDRRAAWVSPCVARAANSGRCVHHFGGGDYSHVPRRKKRRHIGSEFRHLPWTRLWQRTLL